MALLYKLIKRKEELLKGNSHKELHLLCILFQCFSIAFQHWIPYNWWRMEVYLSTRIVTKYLHFDLKINLGFFFNKTSLIRLLLRKSNGLFSKLCWFDCGIWSKHIYLLISPMKSLWAYTQNRVLRSAALGSKVKIFIYLLGHLAVKFNRFIIISSFFNRAGTLVTDKESSQ